ncbi:MAG TPA: hypothetical protein VHV75_19275, partial [Solirubrobacteraceae bacterium]|nr:hypothetical protein [Solirubrobacteraceae bacterium]
MQFTIRALVALATASLALAVPAAGQAAPRHHGLTAAQKLERRYEPYTGCVGYHDSKTEPFYCSRFA